MIIDLTEEFRQKLRQFQKISATSNLEQQKTQKQKHQPFKQNMLEYQLSLKTAKSVYLSLCRIQGILRDKRDNYFSNAAYSLSSFTNQQRNEFDEETKAAIKICSDQIDQLKEIEVKYKKINSKTNQTYQQHLKQVIMCLHHHFKKLQAQFTEFLQYNQQKKKKILSTLSIEPQVTHVLPQNFEKRREKNEMLPKDGQNTDMQLQRQAHLFYVQKIEDQKKAIQTKKIIQSISTMLQQTSKKVLDQELLTSSFEEIGSVGLDFIEQGNKNLLEANKLSKQTGMNWVLLFLGLAFSLLLVDFLKS